MDINQTVRMIEWLDEERRRDKVNIARLEERLKLQQELLDALQIRLNGFQSEQAALRNGQQGVNRERETEIVEELRSELLERLAAGEARRHNAEAESRRRSEQLHSQLDQPMRELAGKVAELERRQGGLPSMQTESDRVSAALSELGQRVDDIYGAWRNLSGASPCLRNSAARTIAAAQQQPPAFPSCSARSTRAAASWTCSKT